jgi:hypothetical protein
MNEKLKNNQVQDDVGFADCIAPDSIELRVNAERLTPELRAHLEYRLAKNIATKALLELDIQLLEIALDVHNR